MTVFVTVISPLSESISVVTFVPRISPVSREVTTSVLEDCSTLFCVTVTVFVKPVPLQVNGVIFALGVSPSVRS